MMQQGIDMLMVNSAVKVGSQGSKSIDWSSYPQDANESQASLGKPTFNEGF